MANVALITGAAGLLGRATAAALGALGWKVICAGRTATGGPDGLPGVALELTDERSFTALPARVDAVLHLAQSSRFRDFPEEAADVFGVNVTSTAKMLDYARRAGASHFVYASTGGVYAPSREALGEDSALLEFPKLGAYFGSKLCGEILTFSYASIFSTTILRPFFMYGPGQKRSMHLPRLYDRVRAGEPVQLTGPDGIRINPVHVADAASAVAEAVQRPSGGVVNLAGPEVLSMREIATAFGRHCGCAPVFEHSGPGGLDLVADVSLMGSRLIAPRRRLFDHLDDIAV